MSESTWARSSGKQAVRARTVWQLEIPPTAYRCLKSANPDAPPHEAFVLEQRVQAGWGQVALCAEPIDCLQKVVTSPAFQKLREALTPTPSGARDDG